MILYATILAPLLFALLIVLRPERDTRQLALLGTLVPVALTVWALLEFDWTQAGAIQLSDSIPWLTALGGVERVRAGDVVERFGGVTLSVGVDSVSLLLLALTVLLGPVCVVGSFSAITERVRTYYAWLLVLQGAMTAVFAARDLVLFYIAFEFVLVPMWVLINLYGSADRRRAATRFFLYTFTGSLIALAGLVYVAWRAAGLAGFWNFDLGVLERAARHMHTTEQAWVMLALLAGFAVKVPLFPLHTWLPLAHTEAPTAGSVILAGVLLKLGTYGLYRFVLPFCPQACVEYAPVVAAVAIVGVLYAGLICWVQTDFKKLIAYSSVAHLGFCVLGMFAFNAAGLSGSVLYMLNHGLSTGALFLLVGMVYERYHTRSMRDLQGLGGPMPVWATFMVFFTLASVGLPGLNGFVGEFLCLLGAWQAGGEGPGATGGRLGPWYAAVAGTGMIVAAMYLLYMLGVVVWGRASALVAAHEPQGPGHAGRLPRDLSAREIGVLTPLALGCLVLGVWPTPVLNGLHEPVNQTARVMAQAGGWDRQAGLSGTMPGGRGVRAVPARASRAEHTP